MVKRTAPNDGSRSRGAVLAAVVLLHAAAFAALLRIESVRKTPVDPAPLWVSLIQPEPPKIATPHPPSSIPKIVSRKAPSRRVSVDKTATLADTFIAPPPLAESAAVLPTFETLTPRALSEPATDPAPVAPPAAIAEPAPTPKLVTRVEYLRPPDVHYPVASRRLGEQGRVLLRVYIDREGRAQHVEVQESSGSRRLDKAAMTAAREALYRPYSENGQPIPVWALIPTIFELS